MINHDNDQHNCLFVSYIPLLTSEKHVTKHVMDVNGLARCCSATTQPPRIQNNKV